MAKNRAADSQRLTQQFIKNSLSLQTSSEPGYDLASSPSHDNTGIWGHIIDESPDPRPEDLSFHHWGLNAIFSLVPRNIWDGSDEYDRCLNTVCENTTSPLETLCHSNNARPTDRFQQWTCQFCWPNQSEHESAIHDHCLMVGSRSALLLHTAVGLFFGSIALTLLVWGLIVSFKQPCGVEKDEEAIWSKKPQEQRQLNARKLSKTRPNKRDGRVPIMPPAPSSSGAKQPSNQMDGSVGDVELALMVVSALHAIPAAASMGSSSTEPNDRPVASRRSSVNRSVTQASDHAMRR